METFNFNALGTTWSIMVDHDTFPDIHKKTILNEVGIFEQQFSRFLPESEVNRFRTLKLGEYEISERLSVMLERAMQLKGLTGGIYDPAIGGLLERAGYGMKSERAEKADPNDFVLPKWSLQGTVLTIDGPVVFDLGGIGKGFCIDMAGSAIERLGYQYYLVEGGGDMYGTTKRDGSPYRVALEWPGKTGTAFGVVELDHAGVAVSDSFRRRWPASAKAGRDEKKWHHIIDPQAKKPIASIVGCAALARNAFDADSMTSGLFLSPQEKYEMLRGELGAEYVVFREDETITVSPHWPGELF